MTAARTPLVSVVMPVFNCERFVASAIESVLAQTYKRIELVIVDDGSKDRTRDEIARFSDSRIRVHVHETNRGIAASRNNGIAAATGEYVAWLDSDDVAGADRLSAQVDFLESQPDFGLCATNAVSIDAEGKQTSGPWWPSEGRAVHWDMIWGNPIAQSSVMLRRRLLQENNLSYDMDYPPAEDYHLWCRLLGKTRLYRLAQPFLQYRALEGGAFKSQKVKALRMSLEANREMLKDLVQGEVPDFHPYLTEFAAVLPGKEWKEPAREIRGWFRSVQRALRSAGLLDVDERRRSRADADDRVHSITRDQTSFSHSCFNLEFRIRRKLAGLRARMLRVRR